MQFERDGESKMKRKKGSGVGLGRKREIFVKHMHLLNKLGFTLPINQSHILGVKSSYHQRKGYEAKVCSYITQMSALTAAYLSRNEEINQQCPNMLKDTKTRLPFESSTQGIQNPCPFALYTWHYQPFRISHMLLQSHPERRSLHHQQSRQ